MAPHTAFSFFSAVEFFRGVVGLLFCSFFNKAELFFFPKRVLPSSLFWDARRQLRLGGKTKNGKKTKMAHSTIWHAMERDETNFLRNEDRTYFLADKLEKKKETKEKKETRGRFNVNRADWDDTKFPGMHFHKDENKWCPLCNGRTVDRDGSFCHLLFFSLDYLSALTEELLERARGEVKMEDVRDSLHLYFQDKKFHVESGVENFDSFRRHVRGHDGIICHKCLNEAKSELKDQIEGR